MSAERHHRGISGLVTRFFVRHTALGWVCMAAILAWGAYSATTLPQQEDPTFPTHDAVLVTQCPGLDVWATEKSVTTPLENALSKLPSIQTLASRTRPGVSVIVITLKPDSAGTIKREWQQVRALLKQVSLPKGCHEPELDTDYQLPATLLLSVTRAETPDGPRNAASFRELSTTAANLAAALRKVPVVGSVRLTGEATPERALSLFPGAMAEHHVSMPALKSALASSTGEPARFPNEDELLDLTVSPTGAPPVKLGELASLDEESAYRPEPVETLVRGTDGRASSVLLAVEMKHGGNIRDFDHEVRSALGTFTKSLPAGVDLVTLSDQAAATAQRIDQFRRCFFEAVAVVVLVTLLFMDFRTALVVAAAIPLTLAMTVGGMALLGVPLQQISIAALIISLGMLVDDPVVAADGINRELAAGQPRGVAAWLGPYKLRRAIFFGTLINIAAFLPLALLPGDMGAFIISLPVVITLALVSSRLVSMTFVPLLGGRLLHGQPGFERGGEVRSFFLLRPLDKLFAALLPPYRATLERALSQPARVVLAAYGLLAMSCGLIPFFGKQFFPAAERNQVLVDISLPEDASLSRTQDACRKVAAVLADDHSVLRAAVIAGGGMPMFYYNVLPREPGPNVAQILIITQTQEDVPGLISRLRTRLDADVPEARCIVKQLQQGPAMEAPIQVQITGDDPDGLRASADEVSRLLSGAGAYQVHDDLGARVDTLSIALKSNAAPQGLTEQSLGREAFDALKGIHLAGIQDGSRVLPVMVRAPDSLRTDAAGWRDLTVQRSDRKAVRLGDIADVSTKPEYPVISHLDRKRSVTVKAFAHIGELASRTLDRARPGIARMALPPGWSLTYAGEERELNDSQREMSRVMAVSLLLIALTMLVQFRSMAKSLVVMLTVPLGLIGAFVGLAATQASFGFMALLGIVSLAGVVVSHIIVLSDFIEDARKDGVPLREALVQAGLVRLRAVLATTFATVCALVPLALSGGSLWRPLTSVHIFGLLFASQLTLVLLPVLYCLFCERLRWIK